MKLSNWSIFGGIIGIIFAIGSFIRYFIIFSDTSETVIGIFIGVLIIAVSFLYDKQIKQGNTIEDLEEYIVDNAKD